jgi:hypothetical protein
LSQKYLEPADFKKPAGRNTIRACLEFPDLLMSENEDVPEVFQGLIADKTVAPDIGSDDAVQVVMLPARHSASVPGRNPA